MISSKGINLQEFYYNDLFRDYIFDFKNINDFYRYDYRNIKQYKKRITDIKNDYNNENRGKIYDILESYNRNIDCSKKTLENIKKFKSKDSVVVIGGQQPGFLTGPIFIIYKIITILKVSSYFEKILNVPVVPCFWNASDDSNFSHVDNLNILDDGITEIKLDLSDFNVKTRYSDIYLSADKIEKAIENVAGTLHNTDFTAGIIKTYRNILTGAVKNCPVSEKKINISSFFSSVVTHLFSDYGIVIIDPATAELKRLSLDLVRFDMENHKKITDSIVSYSKSLKKRHYHNQLDLLPGTLDFFLKSGNRRIRIYSGKNYLFRVSDREYNKTELWDLIRENHGDVSLNVVLRPLFQDKFLPVLCSVCGPGEVSYFAQLKPVYDLAAVKMPVIYPRYSATIIEKKIEKLMEKLKIQDMELKPDREEMTRMATGKNLKIDMGKSMQDFEEDMQKRIERFEKTVSGYGMNISSSFDRIKRNMKKEIKVLEKKLYSGYRKQNEFMVKSIDKIHAGIFPNGNMQEREINITGYLNKYSFDFIDELYRIVKPMDFLHKFIKVG